jgi:hypothetical protein
MMVHPNNVSFPTNISGVEKISRFDSVALQHRGLLDQRQRRERRRYCHVNVSGTELGKCDSIVAVVNSRRTCRREPSLILVRGWRSDEMSNFQRRDVDVLQIEIRFRCNLCRICKGNSGVDQG